MENYQAPTKRDAAKLAGLPELFRTETVDLFVDIVNSTRYSK